MQDNGFERCRFWIHRRTTHRCCYDLRIGFMKAATTQQICFSVVTQSSSLSAHSSHNLPSRRNVRPTEGEILQSWQNKRRGTNECPCGRWLKFPPPLPGNEGQACHKWCCVDSHLHTLGLRHIQREYICHNCGSSR